MLAMFQFKKCETVASEMSIWWRQSQTLSNLWWMRWKILKNRNIKSVFSHTSKYSLTKYYYGKLCILECETIYCFLHVNIWCFSCSNLHLILFTSKKHCWRFHVCGQSYAIISHYFLVDLFLNHRLYWRHFSMFHKTSFFLKLLNF